MRDLTDEELALAPEWATHYCIDKSSSLVEVCFFNNEKSVNVCGGKLLEPYFNEVGIEPCDREIPPRKPFDITQHEWSSGDFIDVFKAYTDDTHLHFFIAPYCHGRTWINKSDAIAIAKHFKLNAEDLA